MLLGWRESKFVVFSFHYHDEPGNVQLEFSKLARI